MLCPSGSACVPSEGITSEKYHICICVYIQDVQLKNGPYFNISNLFTKIYNMLYYTTKLNSK